MIEYFIFIVIMIIKSITKKCKEKKINKQNYLLLYLIILVLFIGISVCFITLSLFRSYNPQIFKTVHRSPN